MQMRDGTTAVIKDSHHFKVFKNSNYNYFFDKNTGFFCRWGNASQNLKGKMDTRFLGMFTIWSYFFDDDMDQFFADIQTEADMSKSVPEILDMEISEICDGVPGIGPCSFCYKSNVGNRGDNMTLSTFKKIFDKLPKSITQIAFGIGNLSSHPEMWDIFDYARQMGLIPNITINGNATKEDINKLSKIMGAVAVSCYDRNLTYDTIQSLTDKGMRQINIHQMISEETYEDTYQILKDRLTDERLSKMNAVVLLSLKPKGRSKGRYTQLSQEKFNQLIEFSIQNNLSIGFDSCSAAKVNNFISLDPENRSYMETFIEPCEASHYSTYVNVRGEYYPCSFAEGENEWKQGIQLENVQDFMSEVWNNPKVRGFGDKVQNCRQCNIGCPIYEI